MRLPVTAPKGFAPARVVSAETTSASNRGDGSGFQVTVLFTETDD
jgi:hypothetical protein